MTTDEKDFLARWSRRKQAAREGLPEPEAETPDVPAKTPAEAPAEDAEAPDESAFADVDFDTLDYSSDYTRFMGKDVPEMVQRRALRALWRSDPVLANIDGLNDYDEDFTDAALVVQNLASAYKPGRGYKTDEEVAAEEAQAAESQGAPEDEENPAATEALEQPAEKPVASAEGTEEPAAPDQGQPAKA